MKKAFLHIDIMRGERHLKTIHMPYCPLFQLTSEQVMDYIKEKCPALYGRGGEVTFHIYTD